MLPSTPKGHFPSLTAAQRQRTQYLDDVSGMIVFKVLLNPKWLISTMVYIAIMLLKNYV